MGGFGATCTWCEDVEIVDLAANGRLASTVKLARVLARLWQSHLAACGVLHGADPCRCVDRLGGLCVVVNHCALNPILP